MILHPKTKSKNIIHC